MSAPWFHAELPAEADTGSVIELADAEGRHATGARRLGDGSAVVLFDGTGRLADGVIVSTERRITRVRIEGLRFGSLPAPEIHLAFAVPKGDRYATLVSMATQLGVDALQPMVCERSVVRPTATVHERFRRVALEACKQSRRATMPRLEQVADPATVVGSRGDAGPVWLAHAGGQALGSLLARSSGDGAITVLVGPEGGFAPGEVEAAEGAGAVRVSLGDAVLRIETAAVAIVAAIRLATPVDSDARNGRDW